MKENSPELRTACLDEVPLASLNTDVDALSKEIVLDFCTRYCKAFCDLKPLSTQEEPQLW